MNRDELIRQLKAQGDRFAVFGVKRLALFGSVQKIGDSHRLRK
jgi:hypothetical protein